MKFDEKLLRAIKQTGSVLSIGLDPNPDFFPEEISRLSKDKAAQTLAFCEGVINSTHKYACSYKINTAYFEALGKQGLDVFGQVKEMIPSERITIADAKRGDVGHTAGQYKIAFFEVFNFDAVTLSPLMGFDTLKPYLDAEDKAVFILTLTSNAGAGDFFLKPFSGSGNLSSYIAGCLRDENLKAKTSVGMVIGATQDAALQVLGKFPESNLLIPGIGAQGGSVAKLQDLLKTHRGIPVIPVSRGILYPKPQSGLGWKQLIEKQSQYYHQQLQTISNKYV